MGAGGGESTIANPYSKDLMFINKLWKIGSAGLRKREHTFRILVIDKILVRTIIYFRT